MLYDLNRHINRLLVIRSNKRDLIIVRRINYLDIHDTERADVHPTIVQRVGN